LAGTLYLSFMKRKLLLSALVVVALVFSGFLILKSENPDQFLEQRAEFVMREIGHRILLHAGDSVSQVLPVKRLNERAFQLEFSKDFTFMADTLLHIVQSSLAARNIPLQYTVSVRDCKTDQMIYGYEMILLKPKEIACLGRVQPVGCYRVQIIFLKSDEGVSTTHYAMAAGIVLLALVGFVFGMKKKEIPQVSNQISLRGYNFDENKRTLKDSSGKIELTHKEARVLSVLVANANQIVKRDQLVKEVWGREGVIVGRSLDVFISKLRKKFTDPHIRIVNIHGNGYKLEID
jgi:hypothetical protein